MMNSCRICTGGVEAAAAANAAPAAASVAADAPAATDKAENRKAKAAKKAVGASAGTPAGEEAANGQACAANGTVAHGALEKGAAAGPVEIFDPYKPAVAKVDWLKTAFEKLTQVRWRVLADPQLQLLTPSLVLYCMTCPEHKHYQ
jgi:hypothetical protein